MIRSAFIVGSSFPCVLFGQDQAGETPSLPSGFSSSTSLFSLAEGKSKQFEGLDLSLGFSGRYESNVTQVASDKEQDWVYTPKIDIGYLLGNSRWNLSARGNYAYESYQERDDFSGANYSFTLSGGYQSQKLNTSLDLGLSSASGINRIAGGFIEQKSFKSGLSSTYRLSGKTSLDFSWNQTSTESRTQDYGDTSSVTAGLSAMWQATPLISVGPGIRYGVRTGYDEEEFTVVGPTVRFDYELSTKVALNSSFGMDRSDSPYSRDDSQLNWAIGLNYRASSLWGFNLQAIQDTQATLSTGGGFSQVASYKLSHWRKIRKAQVEVAVTYEDRSSTDTRSAAGVTRDVEYLTFSAAVRLPVFRERADMSFYVRQREQTSKNVDLSWDGVQTGLDFTYRF